MAWPEGLHVNRGQARALVLQLVESLVSLSLLLFLTNNLASPCSDSALGSTLATASRHFHDCPALLA